MASDHLFSSLARVAAQLPFGIHDTDQVNAAFEQWSTHNDLDQKRVVDLWTYCFVRRYVLLKFTVERTAPSADLEMLVERIYRKIERNRHTVQDARSYAGWVSVVSRNTYLNYLRAPIRTRVVDTSQFPLTVAEPADPDYDTGVLLDALHAAIDRLPPYLREVARLRFIEDLSYTEIQSRINQPLPVIRSYVSKTLHRFRNDHALERLLRADVDEIVRERL